MPFFRPFKEDFTNKDLLYGLNEWRDIYIEHYQVFESVHHCRNYIDSYNITPNEMIRTFQTVKAKRRRHLLKIIKADPKNSLAYKAQPFRFEINKGKARIENPIAVFRKTKSGLLWAAQCANTNNEFQIHFILDGIRMPEVILKMHESDKNYYSFKSFFANVLEKNKENNIIDIETLKYNPNYDNSIIKSRAVTGVELRWLYRNRHDVKVQKSIQFWYAGKPCCPPWEKEFDQVANGIISPLWQLYQPKQHNVGAHDAIF